MCCWIIEHRTTLLEDLEVLTGIQSGLADAAAGRYKTLADYHRDFRKRHNLSDGDMHCDAHERSGILAGDCLQVCVKEPLAMCTRCLLAMSLILIGSCCIAVFAEEKEHPRDLRKKSELLGEWKMIEGHDSGKKSELKSEYAYIFKETHLEITKDAKVIRRFNWIPYENSEPKRLDIDRVPTDRDDAGETYNVHIYRIIDRDILELQGYSDMLNALNRFFPKDTEGVTTWTFKRVTD